MEQQVRLQRAQQTERRYLAAAFTRVGDLERRRAAGQAQVLAAFVRIYRAELVPIQEIAGEPWQCFKVSVLRGYCCSQAVRYPHHALMVLPACVGAPHECERVASCS